MDGVLVSQADIANLRSIYPLLEIKPFTTQQEMFLYGHLKGLKLGDAAANAGMDPSAASRFMKREDVEALLHFIRSQYREDIGITVESLIGMLMEAHSKAATATEEINAIREMGKMLGLYESDKLARQRQEVTLNLGDRSPTSEKGIERMSDEDLLRTAFEGEVTDLTPRRESENAQ